VSVVTAVWRDVSRAAEGGTHMADSTLRPAAPGPYRIVVGTDFSALGDRAVAEGLRLSTQYPHAELHVITVATSANGGVLLPGPQPHVLPMSDAQEQARLRVAKISDAYFAAAPSGGLDKIAVYVAVGAPAERIVALAAAADADLIVLGTHGRHGVERILLGSVAHEVLRRAPCGVFVLRPRDFLDGEQLPQIQPPLQPGEHPLQPFRESVTYHYVDRLTEGTTSRLMPAI
jgi:nucleotide-binding universal stress UspA family protein